MGSNTAATEIGRVADPLSSKFIVITKSGVGRSSYQSLKTNGLSV